ncbi:Mor transcription activator family protein [Lysobacter yananisis]|uniref:Mor transcription activator family protein n=1 Tax=Lysobacter yananisis TaxID=1003114 RepID=A0ABY9P8W7_9GAMM|nr:Mor transcription activator family protein [Lysobacter yananisis]WMT03344.1 Mor transcription activator family protein [Lysobacter yananisis]
MELLAFTDDLVQRVLLAHGIDPALAAQCGAAVADGLSEAHAGQTVYYPFDAGYKMASREQEILEAHRGGARISELRQKYHMSDEGIRKLLRRAAARNPDLDQLNLFGQS